IIDFFDGLYTTVKAPTTQSDKIWLRSGPNPFNSSGNISFYIDLETNVDLTIYNQKGIPVRKLYSGKLTKGIHEFPWDGSGQSGNKLPGGIYLCRLTAGNSFRTIGIIINSN
ncbi:MAG: T9SS type A sorting domain-containing protein, partial [Bacteroidales bacterium]|nr:T9SS type A sorting domain-containing protein [Bacteroidales bacterium]